MRLPALSIALLAALSATGCGRAPRRPVLNFWFGNWNADTRVLMDGRLIPEFERAHRVDVKVSYLSWSHLDEQLTITFAGGVQPDVFQVGSEYVGSMAYRGQAAEIDGYVKGWPQRTDFIPASWSTVVSGGHVYGVPYSSAPRLLLYRKDLYRKAGLSAPAKTWGDWVRAATTLTRRDARGSITQPGIYFSPVGNWQYFVIFLWQNGGSILTADGRHAAFNSPEGVQALQYFVDLFRKYKVCPPDGLATAATAVPLFAAGQAAQEINNPLAIRNVVQYAKDFGVKDLAVSVPPTNKIPVVAVYTSWLAMSAQCRHKELAWELMKFLTRPDNLIAYNKTQYFVPPIRSAANSDYVRSTPFMPEFVRGMEQYGRSLPPIPEWFEMRVGLHTAVDQAIYGDKTPKQALDDYARDVDRLLALRYAQSAGSASR
jgi:multiple sugar transport system substrate-binding protein